MLPLRGMARGLSVQRLGPKAFLADPGAYKDDQNQAQGWHGMARQTDFNHLDADSGQTKILAQRFVPCPPPPFCGGGAVLAMLHLKRLQRPDESSCATFLIFPHLPP